MLYWTLYFQTLTNGALDLAFGNHGIVLTDFLNPMFGGSSDIAYALALQPDGKIVAAGGVDRYGGFPIFALARYRPNGTLDPALGSHGKVTTSLLHNCECDHDEFVSALAIQPDGKIVAAGSLEVHGRSSLSLVRYLPNGALDPAFGDAGTVLTEIGEESASAAVALQLDGKIVVTGNAGDYEYELLADFVLARYLPNGTLDPPFGDHGTVLTDFGSDRSDVPLALAIQPHDGRVVVAGSSNRDFALARYHAHTCGGVPVTQIGTQGNDVIMGTNGNDVIYAFGGTDVVDGLGGDDMLCGGSGDDTLRGGSGNDILRGEYGTDMLDGGTGTDRCDGGPGSADTAQNCETVTNIP